MTTARDIMTPDVACIGEQDSVLTAARRMAELGVGSLPICGSDQRLKGMLTDRDIVVKVLAEGRDPDRVRAGELAQGEAVIFFVNQRPVNGTRGTYRVAMRHGVSRVRAGRRMTLGLIFHDAA